MNPGYDERLYCMRCVVSLGTVPDGFTPGSSGKEGEGIDGPGVG